MRSLRGRLTFGVISVMAIVVAIGGVLVARDADRSERHVLDDRLRRTAELSRATAIAAVEKQLPDIDRRLDAVLAASDSTLRLSIGQTTLLDSGRTLKLTSRPPLGLHTITLDGRHYRVFSERLREVSLGGLGRIEVTSSLTNVEERQQRLRQRLTVGGLVLLLVAGVGVWLAADLVLRPLRRLRGAVAEIVSEEDLDRRVSGRDGPEEIRTLAASFNQMLARLGESAEERNRALAATRRFAADVGHELRTPLTSVQATLSALARHPQLDAERRTGLAEHALSEQRRLVDLLDGLQALARGEAGPVPREVVDLANLVADAAGAATERYPGTRFSVQLPPDPVPLTGWSPGLRSLVDNLIGNAAHHGPDGGQVWVTLSASPAPVLTVSDDGPGVPVEERERIFEAFARVPGAERPGSGLGLALVAQQARLHDATVAVGVSEAGGAQFTVRF